MSTDCSTFYQRIARQALASLPLHLAMAGHLESARDLLASQEFRQVRTAILGAGHAAPDQLLDPTLVKLGLDELKALPPGEYQLTVHITRLDLEQGLADLVGPATVTLTEDGGMEIQTDGILISLYLRDRTDDLTDWDEENQEWIEIDLYRPSSQRPQGVNAGACVEAEANRSKHNVSRD